ncbi:MAG: flagellar protein export ATPase FliI [Firmicutes bacterium]|nr:flagellar protein export ATPase FliI [Dethiobacter sp.]MBS3888640.1 flagellar protein export ATPase FliI [Bacillota bacterium]MBS4054445.1 flagellar protein export ATPase FliI [Thermaerobacter sp.]
MNNFSYDFTGSLVRTKANVTWQARGRVTEVVGLTVEARGFRASIGELCRIGQGEEAIEAEVVGFSGDKLYLFPFRSLYGISPGSVVEPLRQKLVVHCGEHMLGRVIDGLGRPLAGISSMPLGQAYPLDQAPPNPMSRTRIEDVLETGVKAIDLFLTAGHGQRLGIFAGSGVGKSTILGMIARGSTADCNVIALVGERGREVRDFLEKDLGPEGLRRSVVVVATSDQSALLRIKAALTATAVAEYFRDQGKNVMLLMDSVTRFAMSQREIGLAIGEPPTTRGYPPSVFALLPKLLERSGTGERGAITALYTVLVEGDDMNEPIADTVRGILDGHIVLSRHLAERNHYPSIDVLQSVSRLATELAATEHLKLVSECRSLLAVYKQNEDLINIGAYIKGSSREIDESIDKAPRIMAVLAQGIDERYSLEEALSELRKVMAR